MLKQRHSEYGDAGLYRGMPPLRTRDLTRLLWTSKALWYTEFGGMIRGCGAFARAIIADTPWQ
ncbi:MAG: hypothetical protein U9Q79_04715 [Candidatus Hydrogenedentes bacterium]|nr:hypothetical protein [Candidatus Hydrogenedentota bacterium]